MNLASIALNMMMASPWGEHSIASVVVVVFLYALLRGSKECIWEMVRCVWVFR